MRIVIDGRFYGLENGGLGRYVINLVKELARQDKHNNYFLLLRKKYYRELDLPANWEKVLVDFRHYSLAEQIRLPFIIRQLRPGLVHFPHFNVPIFYRGRHVVTVHDILMHRIKGKNATTLPRHKYLLKRIGYKLVFGAAVRQAERILVPTKTVKGELVDFYKIDQVKVKVTSEGYSIASRATGKSELFEKYKLKQPYFFYVGNSFPHKNLNRLIEAARDSGHEVVIVTPRDFFGRKLKEAARGARNVKVLGFVPDEDLRGLYRHSHALLYPSLIEGFGLQGLEAIASGTMIMMSDIPVFHEVYGKHAVYFNPFDFSAIENAMHMAIDMPRSVRSKRIKESKVLLSKYSWEKMAKQTLEVYEEVLGE